MATWKKDPGVSKLTTPGFIYFIQAEDGGLIKIGWATCPKTRMARMQAHGPLRLTILHSEHGNGKEEAALHHRFAAERRHGEWFEPSPALLAEIEDRRGRNHQKVYEPGVLLPPPLILEPRKPRKQRVNAEKYGPVWPPPKSYWEYGNPGWDKLTKAMEVLQ